MTNEEFYDAMIAPSLLDLARKCQERGLSFVAAVEYGPGDTGETVVLQPDATFKIQLAAGGIRCHGNVDSLMLWAAKHAKTHGHSSLVLTQMGVIGPTHE